MKIVLYVVTLLLFIQILTAYDIFQGTGRLTRPCFPAYDHPECKKDLLESYDPPIKGEGVSRNPARTLLFLFTPKSQDKAEQLHQCAGLPPRSTFDPTCPTQIIVHGYGDGLCRSAWMREMKEQLFQRSSCYNIILVDWTWGNFIDIASGSSNAKVAGQQVGYVLKKIAQQTNYNCTLFHFTGHSYGAVVTSYCGKVMQEKCRLGRLTALDAAYFPFLFSPEKDFLNPSDALLVDTVHSNSGFCPIIYAGDPRPLGHRNFYVNDGSHQPGCYPYALESFLKLDLIYATACTGYPMLCFHGHALQYYKASILANTDDTLLVGVQCNNYDEWISGQCERNCQKEGNCLPMGLDTSAYVDYRNLSNERLVYYVPAAIPCPYSDHSGFTGLPLKIVNDQEPPI